MSDSYIDSAMVGLGIFTDRNQRSIFWVLNFKNLCVFFGGGGGLLRAAVFFFGCYCIFKCFIFLTVSFGSIFICQVLQQ